MGTISKLPAGKNSNEKTLDERFVEEYLIDRDPVSAAIRVGVRRQQLENRVRTWMSNPDVLRKIREATDGADIDSMITPQRVMAGFIEVAFDKTAPAASRNAALRELAQFKKMYPEKEDPDKNRTYARNVMFVPAAPSLEDWEKAATAQQATLREDVRK